MAARCEPVFLPATKTTGFLPDLDALDDALLARTVAVYFGSPSNPQGGVTELAYLKRLIALARNPFPVIRYDGRMGDQIVAEFDVCAPHWWSELPDVQATAMVISGGEKSFLPPRHLRTLSDALPNSRFVTIEAGHSVHRDRAEEFVTHVDGFLGH